MNSPAGAFLTIIRAQVLAALVGLGACCMDAPDMHAQEPDSTDSVAELSKDEILDLIDQLDADKVSARKSAEKELINAGLAALPHLPEKPVGFSVEAAERLGRVRAALMQLKAKSQSAAIRIRLGEAKTLGDALEVISRESQIEFEHNADESLAIQAADTPLSFWHALDIVLDQANLDVNHYGGDQSTMQLIAREEGRQSRVDSAAYTGVYRIETMSVSARRVFNQPNQSGLNLSMQITWQPGMTPIGLTIPVADLAGKLDDDQPVRAQSTEQSIDIVANSELAFSEFYLPLELPVDRPGKIDSLSGSIESLLPGKKHDFELPLTEPGSEKKVDAVTVRLEQVQPNGGLYEIRISIDLDDADRALESHRQWIYQNPVFVLDSSGNRLEHLGYELYRRTEESVGLGYLFDIQELEGAKLLYQSPTSVTKNRVEFLLQDIALP